MTPTVYTQLGDIAKLIRGVTFKPQELVPVGSPRSAVCFRTANIQAELDQSDLISVPRKVIKRSEQRLRTGDLLVSSANSWNLVGKCVAVPDLPYDATAGGFISILRPQTDRVDPRYLYLWLNSSGVQHRVRQCARQTTSIANLSVERFLELTLLLPPIPEQRRIAVTLEKADAIRRNRECSLALVDTLARSVFFEMFGNAVKEARARDLPLGWRVACLESIAAGAANSCAGGPFGSSLGRSDYAAAGVPVIRGNNLIAGRGEFRDEGFVFVSPAKADELRRNIALPGDVIFTQRGTLGQVAQIPFSAKYDRYIISQSQMKVTPDTDVIDPTYLVHYFLSPRAQSELAHRTVATGVPHINLSILKNFTVVLPPLPLQRRFAAFVAQQATARRSMKRAYREAERLAKSLAHSVFEREVGDRAINTQ